MELHAHQLFLSFYLLQLFLLVDHTNHLLLHMKTEPLSLPLVIFALVQNSILENNDAIEPASLIHEHFQANPLGEKNVDSIHIQDLHRAVEL